jgi:hypothetical protein
MKHPLDRNADIRILADVPNAYGQSLLLLYIEYSGGGTAHEFAIVDTDNRNIRFISDAGYGSPIGALAEGADAMMMLEMF